MLTKTILPAFVCLALFAAPAHAGIVYTVTILTSPLEGDPAAPFSLDFQFNGGSGTGDGNNTAVLSNFLFGAGGAAVGSAALAGGATGDLGSFVQITDTGFLNEFTQGFTPGSLLQFQLALSTNVDAGGTPDQFTMAILDSSGAQLPTLSFFDVFVEIDVDSANPAIQTFASDPSRNTVAGGAPITLSAPSINTSIDTPEPGSIFPVGVLCWPSWFSFVTPLLGTPSDDLVSASPSGLRRPMTTHPASGINKFELSCAARNLNSYAIGRRVG